MAHDFSLLARPGADELKQVLHHDHLAFHTGHFRYLHDFAGTVGVAAYVDEDVDGGGDLLAHRALRQRDARQQHHHLETADALARVVGVDGGDGAVVTGGHRLQHVEHLGAADLADDDAVG